MADRAPSSHLIINSENWRFYHDKKVVRALLAPKARTSTRYTTYTLLWGTFNREGFSLITNAIIMQIHGKLHT